MGRSMSTYTASKGPLPMDRPIDACMDIISLPMDRSMVRQITAGSLRTNRVLAILVKAGADGLCIQHLCRGKL
jgi:hypothetical protein